MFARTLDSIATASEKTLGKPIVIRSINVPHHFAGISSTSNMIRAGENAGFITNGHQVIPHFNGARLAYNLDNCQGYNFSDNCDLDYIESFAIVVDYSKTYFSIDFIHIGSFLCIQIGTRTFPMFGEDLAVTTTPLL